MSDLTKQAEALGLSYECSDSGTWLRYPCPHGGMRYVIQSSLADGYLSWCEASNPARPDWTLHLEGALTPPEASAIPPLSTTEPGATSERDASS